tara:strand:+ start:1285 stop:1743 length:459 start_codon:yes stop_codon:yes gene_type:complete
MNLTINSIDNGIIDILKKKYKVDIYHESSLHYSSKIDKNILQNNINFDYKYTNDVIDKYISLDKNIYRYDIDLINLIIKSIVLKKKLSKKTYEKKYSFIDTINYYLGISPYLIKSSKSNDQPLVSKKIVHNKIKSIYDKIHNDIINHFSILN